MIDLIDEFFSDVEMDMLFQVASSLVDRTAIEPSNESRDGRSDPLRDVQRPRFIHLHPSSLVAVRVRSNNGSGLRFRRWSLARRARVRRLFHPQQHPTDRRSGSRRDGASPTTAPKSRVCVPHERGERSGSADQRKDDVHCAGPPKGRTRFHQLDRTLGWEIGRVCLTGREQVEGWHRTIPRS